jgi:hypothetical protein
MSTHLLSVELEGKKSFLRLRKSPGDKLLIEIELNNLENRDKPELQKLQCNFDGNDLENFKKIKGLSVDVVLQRIVSS